MAQPNLFKAVHALRLKANKARRIYDGMLEESRLMHNVVREYHIRMGKDLFDARLIADEVREMYIDAAPNRALYNNLANAIAAFEAHPDFMAYQECVYAKNAIEADKRNAAYARKLARKTK